MQFIGSLGHYFTPDIGNQNLDILELKTWIYQNSKLGYIGNQNLDISELKTLIYRTGVKKCP